MLQFYIETLKIQQYVFKLKDESDNLNFFNTIDIENY